MKRNIRNLACASIASCGLLVGTGLPVTEAMPKSGEQHGSATQDQKSQDQRHQAGATQGTEKRSDSMNKTDRTATNKGAPLTVDGKITDVRTVTLRQGQGQNAQPQDHLMAKVQLTGGAQQGRTMFIDLGPTKDLEKQNVSAKKDSRIKASGVQGRINGDPVLVAAVFDVDGQKGVTRVHEDLSRKRGSGQQQGS